MSRSGISGTAGTSKGKLQSSPSTAKLWKMYRLIINQNLPSVAEGLTVSIGS